MFTYIHKYMNLCIATVGSVCMYVCACNVRETRPEYLTEDNPVWRIIYSIHLVIWHTKQDKKNISSFPFPVANVEGVWKILKISYSLIDNSAI
jgi:hypothetical protein